MGARHVVTCVFCEILAGRAEATFVHRDEVCAAFMDIQPVNPGHVLVIPVRHAADLSATHPDEWKHIAAVGQRVAAALRASDLECEGVNLRFPDSYGDLPTRGEDMAETPSDFGWDDIWDGDMEQWGAEGGEPARVTVQERDRWTIQTGSGSQPARLTHGALRPRPVTGDWVVAEPGPAETDPWGILAVLPRRTALARGVAGEGREAQVLAANIDRLWVVQALDRAPNLRSLERYLAVAWESGAAPEVVLTKSDLAQDLEAMLDSVRDIALGVPIHVVSTQDEGALRELRDSLVRGQTIALVGPSGVGKSTLINHLAERELTETGAVRAGDRKGRHTTTTRQLFAIHGGALLLDTPGMRELRVLDLDQGLERTFPEIDVLAEGCRFRDCSHTVEPGCAVLEALDHGRLDPDRLASYGKLRAEAEYERRKLDPVAQAEHVAEWKTAMRTLKYHPKHRERNR